MPDYKVKLDVYNGPLDLLLFLIRREEVDIYDIPIARITEQYCRHCETLSRIDPDLAGDFLVMAATLMEIKSRLLLPTPPAESDDASVLIDPRSELVRQLLEYKKYKDASLELGDAARQHAQRWPRAVAKADAASPGEVDLDEVEIWDLVAAFGQLLAETGRAKLTHDVIFDDTPISLHAADILDRLSRDGSMPLARIFDGRNRGEMIGLFLALLELIREARIRATQPQPFGPIELVLLSAEPIEIGEEWDHPRAAVVSPALTSAPPSATSMVEAAPRHAIAAPGADDRDDDEREAFPELDAIAVVDIDPVNQIAPETDAAAPRLRRVDPDEEIPA